MSKKLAKKKGSSGLSRTAAAACCVVAIAQQQQQCSCMPSSSAAATRTAFVVVDNSLRGGSTSSNNSNINNSTGNKDGITSSSKSFTHNDNSNKSTTAKTPKQHDSATKQDDPSKKKQHQESAKNQTQNPEPRKKQQHVPEDYYELLGVPKTATPKQIQKAYRRKAVQYHPDKTNGDRTMFDLISAAYEVLSDETKRSGYDRYGRRGLQDPSAGAASSSPFSNAGAAADIFSSFFGPGFSSSSNSRGSSYRSQQQQAPMRNRNLRYQLEVSLEDLYKGSSRRVTLAQHVNNKEMEITIERGMKDGQSIVLSGENDAIPNAIPGNFIFLLSQTRHPIFTRKDNDLAISVTISLKEALCSTLNNKRTIRHLDGREIVLQTVSSSSSIIQNGEFLVLKGEGMPVRGRPGVYGDLYVQFRVKMPTNTNKQQQQHAVMTKGENELLGSLLDLLTTADSSAGVASSTSPSSAAGYLAERQRAKVKNSLLQLACEYGVTAEDMKNQLQTSQDNKEKKGNEDDVDSNNKKVHYLQAALASDFGTSYPEYDNSEGVEDEDEEDEYESFMRNNDPFQQFRFFSSGRSRSFDFNNSNAQQCQQM